jgi:hypothetical protein
MCRTRTIPALARSHHQSLDPRLTYSNMMFLKRTGITFIRNLLNLLDTDVRKERQHLEDIVEILQEPTLAEVINDRNREIAISAIEHHHLFADESFTDRRIKFFIIATHVHDALLSSSNLPLERDWSTNLHLVDRATSP